MVNKIIGIRREDKSIWEKRVPLVPEQVKKLKNNHGINTIIQPSSIRIFSNDEYLEVGAELEEKIDAPIVFGVKEMPLDFFEQQKIYMFFSHTIKGQSYNMPLLKKIIDLKCTLIDYERVCDEKGRRLIAFGRFAGIAGMIDSLWALGQKYRSQGINTPLADFKRAWEYKGLKDFEQQCRQIGEEIKNKGISDTVVPLVIGIAGYGNVSQGAQEVLQYLPIEQITPGELLNTPPTNSHCLYQVVFKEEDMVVSKDHSFDLQDYYQNPEKYHSTFEKYLPHLSCLINAIYWEPKYPRLLTKQWLQENYRTNSRLQVIGDLGCDIEGPIEITRCVTSPGDPVFCYEVAQDKIIAGYTGNGPVVLAVDILPSELPEDSSQYFGEILLKFIPDLVDADYAEDFEKCSLPLHLKTVIVYQGNLTPDYHYLEQYLDKSE